MKQKGIHVVDLTTSSSTQIKVMSKLSFGCWKIEFKHEFLEKSQHVIDYTNRLPP